MTRARRFRKALGGGWRQAGVLAAAGIVGLDAMVPKLAEDHARAARFANGKQRLQFDYSVNPLNGKKIIPLISVLGNAIWKVSNRISRCAIRLLIIIKH